MDEGERLLEPRSLRAGETPNAANSPMPKTARPPVGTPSVAMDSAVCAGLTIDSRTMPVAVRIDGPNRGRVGELQIRGVPGRSLVAG
jgi:hypothetical protein